MLEITCGYCIASILIVDAGGEVIELTIAEAEEKHGTIQHYIDNLKELAGLDDMRACDVSNTLMDINYIRGEAGLEAMSTIELIERLV